MLRRFGSWLLLGLLIALALWLELGRSSGEEIRTAAGEAVHVIDGDSFRIGDREIRIAGIDAPEYRQTCSDEAGREWACGKDARSALERLVKVGGLSCSKQAEDRYGRALAHCRTAQGDLAKALTRQGWTFSAGDERFDDHAPERAEASDARRGIWRGKHQHPRDWRKSQRRS